MNKSHFLTIALEAVQKAEEIINDYYKDSIRSTLKADQSPVTIADKEAEQVIIKTLKKHFPDHSILGEESGQNSQNSEYLWIIDPIDGTKNYMRKIPLFATQIALMKGNEVILGISNAPVFKECMYAERDKGAYMNGEKVHVSLINNLSSSYMSFGGLNYFQKGNNLDNLMQLVNTTQGHRGIGDFWSYHLLSQGKIDIMIEAQTKLWDIAACSLIVEEAGGKVTDIKGNKISRETTSIIATNKFLHNEVLNIFTV